MAPILAGRSSNAPQNGGSNIQGAVIAICVLSALAGLCAVAVCVHYIWSSESRSLRRTKTARMLLDEALRTTGTTVDGHDKPPPYFIHARPVSSIPDTRPL
ncbi:hypothetical protein FRB91_005292 [Serendipita sp. 411]|nr:hypothetical protein FRC15_011754 [Serendipita sp. 397]KAG8833009.1 hypothetical protein FRC18_004274 [Serendipita sp. 400]KAG8853200.1 hypothetical protein FRB91_005292 [Serendipita sp. 411]